MKKIFKGITKKKITMSDKELEEGLKLIGDIPFNPDRFIAKVGDVYVTGIIPNGDAMISGYRSSRGGV